MSFTINTNLNGFNKSNFKNINDFNKNDLLNCGAGTSGELIFIILSLYLNKR